MRICLPRSEDEAGGSGTFRRLWRTWLTQHGIAWTEDLTADYEVLFVNAWQTRYAQVYAQKTRQPHLRVIQRVDGAGRDYGRTDGADSIQQAVNTLADLTIFQSQYSRLSTLQKYHFIKLDGEIIYNPVDIDHYTPQGGSLSLEARGLSLLPPDRLKVITAIWSPNRRKGAWRIPILARKNPDVTFIFIGQAQFEDPPPNVYILGKFTSQEMPSALRLGDVFLNLSENDPCPNIVLEAMATGLPILYVPSGGTPELVGATGGLPLATDADFRPQLDRLAADLKRQQVAARQRAVENFSQTQIFPHYWRAIEKAQRRPLPSRWQHYHSQGLMLRRWLQDKLVNYRDWLPHA